MRANPAVRNAELLGRMRNMSDKEEKPAGAFNRRAFIKSASAIASTFATGPSALLPSAAEVPTAAVAADAINYAKKLTTIYDAKWSSKRALANFLSDFGMYNVAQSQTTFEDYFEGYVKAILYNIAQYKESMDALGPAGLTEVMKRYRQVQKTLSESYKNLSDCGELEEKLLKDYGLAEAYTMKSLTNPDHLLSKAICPPFASPSGIIAQAKEQLLSFPEVIKQYLQDARRLRLLSKTKHRIMSAKAKEFLKERWPALEQEVMEKFAPLEKKSCTEKTSPNDEEQLRFEPGRWGNLVRATELIRQNKGIGDD